METDAFIALGSNLGDRELNLLLAVAELGKLPGSRVTGLSNFYETSPVGVIDQPSFYNAVVRLATELSPRDLLEQLLRIEHDVFGRVRTSRWGPRRMDLDLLLHGQSVLNEEDLIIPHPRMTGRRFVLQPMCDVAPDLRHPCTGQNMRAMLRGLRSDEKVTKV